MRLLRLSGLILLGIAGILVLAVAVVVTVDWREQLEERLADATGHAVQVGSLDISWQWPPRLTATDIQIDNPEWASAPAMLTAERVEAVLDPGSLFNRRVTYRDLVLVAPELHLERRPDGTANWEFPSEGDGALSFQALPDTRADLSGVERIHIEDGRLLYRTPDDPPLVIDHIDLHAPERNQPIRLIIEGSREGMPISLRATMGSLEELSSDRPYQVDLAARGPELAFDFDGVLHRPLDVDGWEGPARLSVDTLARVGVVLAVPLAATPELDVSGLFVHDDAQMLVDQGTGRFAGDEFAGRLDLDYGASPVQVDLALDFQDLHLDPWLPERAGADGSAIALENIARLDNTSFRLRLDADRAFEGGTVLGAVSLDGRVGPGGTSVSHLEIAQPDGAIRAEGEIALADQEAPPHLQLSLQADDFDIAALSPLIGDMEGRLSGNLRVAGTGLETEEFVDDAEIQADLHLVDGVLRRDGDTLRLPRMSLTAPGRHEPARLRGAAVHEGERYDVDITVESLDRLRSGEQVALRAALEGNGISLNYRGLVGGDRMEGELALSVDDLGRFGALVGTDLPTTPPLEIAGVLTTADGEVALRDARGAVADHPFTELSLQAALNRRPVEVEVAVELDELPLDQWLPTPAAHSDEGALIPDLTLRVPRPGFAIDLRLGAANVRWADLPIGGMQVGLRLADGRLTVDPLTLETVGGTVAGTVEAHEEGAGEGPVHVDVELTAQWLDLDEIMQEAGIPNLPLTGRISGAVELDGAGESIHRLLETADGHLMAVLEEGQIERSIMERVALDISALLGEDERWVPVSCLVLHAPLQAGALVVEGLVIETADALIVGEGEVDLIGGRVDLVLRGETEGLFTLAGPVHVSGPLTNPEAGPASGAVAGQVGAAAVLGIATTPLAAVLPFLDIGQPAEGACGQLAARADAEAEADLDALQEEAD